MEAYECEYMPYTPAPSGSSSDDDEMGSNRESEPQMMTDTEHNEVVHALTALGVEKGTAIVKV